MTSNIATRQRTKSRPVDWFRSPGLLGKWPAAGLTLMLVGSLLFAVCALNVDMNGPLTRTDAQVANDLHQDALQSPPAVIDIMIVGFYVGEQLIVVLGVLLAIYLLFRRYWLEFWMVVIAWAGEGGIWEVLASYYHRARPVFPVEVWHRMTVPGFPSGHSFAAVVCYGLLAYLIAPKLRSGFWKFVVIALALLIILYVGFSRIYVGDHFLSDVLAGYGLGIAWGALVYTAVEVIARRRSQRQQRQAVYEPSPRTAEGK